MMESVKCTFDVGCAENGSAARFDALCRALYEPRRDCGIGSCNEKRFHFLLKKYICDDEAAFEVPIGEKYVADVLHNGVIYEVQTGSLFPLREKIKYYLGETSHKVCVVHPVCAKKRIVWIDKESGAEVSRRLSPHTVSPAEALGDLVYISEFLLSERVTVRLVLAETEEYRLLDGYGNGGKRGSHRIELFPVKMIEDISLSSRADYAALLPRGLGNEFTASEFAKSIKMRPTKQLYKLLTVCEKTGVISPCGKRGRAKLWRALDLTSSLE